MHVYVCIPPGPSDASLDLAWSYARGVLWHAMKRYSQKLCIEAPLYNRRPEAPCTEIIQRAASIMQYDLRHDRLERDPELEICPVLKELHCASEAHSEPLLSTRMFSITFGCL